MYIIIFVQFWNEKKYIYISYFPYKTLQDIPSLDSMRVSQKVYFDKILKPTISVSAAMFTNWASKKSKKCQEKGGGSEDLKVSYQLKG